MTRRASIGIDLGGTKILYALFDEDFKVVDEIKVKTEAEKGEKNFDGNLTESLKSLMSRAKKEDLVVLGVGIGCAGAVDPVRGILRQSLNIPFLKDFPLTNRIAKLTGANVFMINDVQAGLYGEHQLGAAIGADHALGVFLGTGIGGAAILNGKMLLGMNGVAGDIGHYMLSPLGALSGSQRQGVLDDVSSRTAIAGEAAVLAAKHWAPYLDKHVGTDVRDIKSGDLADAIQNGDEHIEELVRSRSRIVGIVLSNFVDFLNPEIIVLGGGLVEAMPALVQKEVELGVREHATAEATRGLKIVVAKLKNHAVTTGAAKFAFDQLLSLEKTSETKNNKALPKK